VGDGGGVTSRKLGLIGSDREGAINDC